MGKSQLGVPDLDIVPATGDRARSLSLERNAFRLPRLLCGRKTGGSKANLTLHLTLQLFCLLVAFGGL
jgi:hypothetical protein